MKAPTLLLILVTFCSNLYSTDNASGTAVRACASSDRHQYRYAMDEDYRNKLDNMEHGLYDIMSDNLSMTNSSKMTNETFTLPIVFHVIHENGPENLSDVSIISALAHLNEAFSNSGSFLNSDGQDSGISFCLADIDPNGNPTDGINRIYSPLTDHNFSDEMNLKDLIRWNPDKYINVWIVKTIENETIGGYAYLAHMNGEDEDGIVIDYNYINSNPVLTVPFIHEIGHYLNLYHTFENGCPNDDCLSSGDKICDTPPDNVTYTGSACLIDNSCLTDCDDNSIYNPFTSDMTDLDISFMDYSQFSCMSIFSPQQILRMKNSLHHYRNSLVQSNACAGSVPPIAGFTQNSSDICAGSQVSFYDISEGYIGTYSWSFPGGTPSTSSQKNPKVIYNTDGNYDVTLTVTNAFGSNQSVLSNAVSVGSSGAYTVFFEDFEYGFGVNLWTIENPDFEETWDIIPTANSAFGEFSCYLNYFNTNSNNETDRLKSKSIDLSNFDNAILELDYAYGSSTLAERDSIKVSIIPEGSSQIPVYTLGSDNQDYSTHSETYEFYPLSTEDWCLAESSCISIDLTAFTGVGNIQFVIEGLSASANNFFIDNIILKAICDVNAEDSAPAPEVLISSSSSQACAGESIIFSASSNNADQLFWLFPGGVPAYSYDTNPTVYYQNGGAYNASVEATGSGGTATSNMTVSINALPQLSISNLPSSTFDASPIALNGFPVGGTFSGDGVVNNVLFPPVAGNGVHQISYTYSDANGCNQTIVQSIFLFSIDYDFATYESSPISPKATAIATATAIDELILEEFTAYPIPAQNELTLDWLTEGARVHDMKLLSADGKILMSEQLLGPAPHKIDLSRFDTGIYFLQIVQGEKSKTLRLSKS